MNYFCFSVCKVSKTFGEIPERPNGADCKSVALQLRRFESYPPHITIDSFFVEGGASKQIVSPSPLIKAIAQ